MLILNLGCGTKVSGRCINIDWSPYLRIRKMPGSMLWARFVIGASRMERFRQLPGSIMVLDLRKPLPFAEGSVDAVCHSHFLEQIDRASLMPFLAEVRRVLRPDGVHRIVVPDWEDKVHRYLQSLDQSVQGLRSGTVHDEEVSALIEHFTRTEAHGTSVQGRFRRTLERIVLGNAARRGETYRWAYDRVNLPALLTEAGFRRVQLRSFDSSDIADWNEIGLDRTSEGAEYRPRSLYIEAVR